MVTNEHKALAAVLLTHLPATYARLVLDCFDAMYDQP
jgi:hypothetical protein